MPTDLPVFPLDHLPLFGEAKAPALIIRDRVYSYEELNLRIGRLAGWLSAQEFTPGDRVATWLGKGEIACLMPLAAVRAVLVHVPVNPLLKAAQVAHIMEDSGARVLITNQGRAITLDASSPNPFVSSAVETPIGGERRWRAAKDAGLETIHAVIRNCGDEESVVLALVENQIGRAHV